MPNGQQFSRYEEFTPPGAKFPIKTYTIKITVDKIPFLAEINLGSYRGQVWHPQEVWVQAKPDSQDQSVKKLLQRSTATATAKGFRLQPQVTSVSFFPLCAKCRKNATEEKFKRALLLPNHAEVDVSATVSLGTRNAGDSIPAREDLILIPYEIYYHCLLHGSQIMSELEPID